MPIGYYRCLGMGQPGTSPFLLSHLGRSPGIWKPFLHSCGVDRGSINTALKESVGVTNHSNPDSFWMDSDTSAVGEMSRCLGRAPSF